MFILFNTAANPKNVNDLSISSNFIVLEIITDLFSFSDELNNFVE